MVGFSIAPVINMYKNKFTSRTFGGVQGRVDNPTIDSVINNSSTKVNPAIAWVKDGHVSGAISLTLGGVFSWLYSKVENKFLRFLFGTFITTNLLNSAASILVGTFAKNDEEVKAKELLDKYVDRSQVKDFDLDRVILHEDHKMVLNATVEQAKKKGVVVNIYGPTGTGKTMTCEAMPQELVKQGVCNKAVFWYVKGGFLDASMKDVIDDIDVPLLKAFIKADGESIPQKIERLVSNALAHYKKTGEYVVLCIDEAQKLLDGGNPLAEMFGEELFGGGGNGRSRIDPSQRPKLIQAYAKLIDRIQQEDCKGIVLMQASNSGGNKYDFLERRVKNLYIDRPEEKERKALIQMYFENYANELGVKTKLSEDQYANLATIGSDDVYKTIMGTRTSSDYSGGSYTTKETYDDDYIGSYDQFKAVAKLDKDKLINYPTLLASDIKEIVYRIVVDCKGKNYTSEQIYEKLKTKLETMTATKVKDVEIYKEEYRLRDYKPIPALAL